MVEVLVITVTLCIKPVRRCYKREIVKDALLFIGLVICKTESNERRPIHVFIWTIEVENTLMSILPGLTRTGRLPILQNCELYFLKIM